MSLDDLRTAVVGTIQAAVTAAVHCAPHGGRFDATELRRVSAKAPAVYVAVLGFRNLEYSCGQWRADVTWGVFAVAKDSPRLDRALGVSALVDRLALVVPDNTWGTENCISMPQGIRGDNLFSASVDKVGVAMWAITWQQRMQLGEAMPAAELASLDPFETLYARYPVDKDVPDVGAAPEAVDHVTLPQDGD